MVPATYSFFFTNYHLATESVTAGTMAGLGDVLAQKQEALLEMPEKPLKHNSVRTSHFVVKGLAEGIAWSYWYRMAEPWSVGLTKAVGGGLLTCGFNGVNPVAEQCIKTFIAIVLDLFIACPVLYGLLDIPIPAILSGASIREVVQQIRSKLGEMMIASLKVWTLVDVVIYNIPVKYRVVVNSMADVFWQSIVSNISSRGVEERVLTGIEDAVPLATTTESPHEHVSESGQHSGHDG